MQVIWFKRDLRISDHQPLSEAAKLGPVLPLYVFEPAYWAQPDTSRRQFEAQRSAVVELADTLDGLGAPLIVRVGAVVDVLARIHRAVGIARLLAHEETGNLWTYARDRAVHRFCRDNGIDFVEYPQFGVIRRLNSRDDWGRLHSAFLNAPPVAAPQHLTPHPSAIAGAIPTAEQLGLSEDGCAQPQSGTRAEAFGLLDSFFNGRGAQYRRAMSSPLDGANACSRLSVPLTTGAISIREVFKYCFKQRAKLLDMPPRARPVPVGAVESLTSRLFWHCHFIQKLESEPALERRSVHPLHEQARQPTPHDHPHLSAWAKGQTGFPFIDACMRSLIVTGWLNFRMRAMVQAFAAYHLALDWHASGLVLARLFTDYEPGIHWNQIQMQAGQTGINIPRIYNPVKQGFDQDPDGLFTRAWVPELAHVPQVFLQEPWRMDEQAQDSARCHIGLDYPTRLIDHEAAARAAKDKITHIRQQPSYGVQAKTVFIRHGSRKKQPQSIKKAQNSKKPLTQKVQRQLIFDL
eukprot:gene12756-12853_t